MQDIEEFKAAYKEAFGEEIADDEAREMAQGVLRLYELLAQKPASDKHDGSQGLLDRLRGLRWKTSRGV